MAEFDRERFKDLVLYIAWETRNDPSFGRVKLAKALFYSDFAAFADCGRSLTGATYQHWQYGPFPPVLYDVEEEIEQEGTASRKPPEHKGDEAKLLPVEEPVPRRRFADWELALADIEIRKVAEPSWKVSDVSHEHPGWELTEMWEDIPKHTVFLSPRKPSDESVERARGLIRDRGWEHEWS